MASNMNQQFKITKLAKDLGLKSKDLVELLAQNGIEAKTTQKALEPAEFDILFDQLTSANQITDIGSYLDGVTYIPSKVKKETKPVKETKAEETPAPAPVAEEKVAAPASKAEPKPEKASESEIVAVISHQFAILQKNGVYRTDFSCFRGNFIQLRHDNLFVGDSNIGSPYGQGSQRLPGILQLIFWNREKFICSLNPQNGKNMLMNLRRKAVGQLFSKKAVKFHQAASPLPMVLSIYTQKS